MFSTKIIIISLAILGLDAVVPDMSYPVAIQEVIGDTTYAHVATGVYLGSGWILTTASAVNGYSEVDPPIMAYRGSVAQITGISQYRYVIDRIYKNRYGIVSHANDLALLHLANETSVFEDKYSNITNLNLQVATPAFLNGGRAGCFTYTYASLDNDNDYQYIEMPSLDIVPMTKCPMYGPDPNIPYKLCVQSSATPPFSCTNDNGSPLICYPVNTRYSTHVIAGLVLSQLACAADGTSLYTALQYYSLWIDRTMKSPPY